MGRPPASCSFCHLVDFGGGEQKISDKYLDLVRAEEQSEAAAQETKADQ